jgi:Uma2 family endonuclease
MVATAEFLKKEKVKKTYTLDEYLRREEKSVDKHEFYNGQIVKMPNAKFYHNLTSGNVSAAIKIAVKLLSKKYLVLGDGQKIYIEPENISVYPDGLVVSEAPIFYKDQEYLLTNPLLIVEVLSRSTQAYDKQGKFDLYTNLPSFHEYVMVDPKRYFVETRFREEEDLWRIKTEKDPTKSVLLRSMGISISLEDIYENVVFPSAKMSRK